MKLQHCQYSTSVGLALLLMRRFKDISLWSYLGLLMLL